MSKIKMYEKVIRTMLVILIIKKKEDEKAGEQSEHMSSAPVYPALLSGDSKLVKRIETQAPGCLCSSCAGRLLTLAAFHGTVNIQGDLIPL